MTDMDSLSLFCGLGCACFAIVQLMDKKPMWCAVLATLAVVNLAFFVVRVFA